jgi:D-alanyl-D-alanine carboxypeptidase-like protein
MDRRCISVCATLVILLLTAANSSAASAARKPGLNTRSSANPRSRAEAARASKSCAPCTAREMRARATRSAKNAKSLPCHPKHYVDPKIAGNYRAAMRDMRRAGIKPKVTSAWRSSAKQAQLHRCSLSSRCRRSHPGLYRALPAGQSIHEAGFAVDIGGVAKGPRGGKRLTPRGRRIVAIMKKNGFNWRYGLADPVHFEADPRKHGYRSVKQAIKRTQTTCQVRLAKRKTTRRSVTKVAASRAPGRARA